MRSHNLVVRRLPTLLQFYFQPRFYFSKFAKAERSTAILGASQRKNHQAVQVKPFLSQNFTSNDRNRGPSRSREEKKKQFNQMLYQTPFRYVLQQDTAKMEKSVSLQQLEQFIENEYQAFRKIETILQVTEMMVNCNRSNPQKVQTLPAFKQISKEIRQYCETSFQIDPYFIPICIQFFKNVATHIDNDILTVLYKRGNQYFEKLISKDKAMMTLNTALIQEDEERSLNQKFNFLGKVQEHLIKNEGVLKEIFTLKDLEKIIIGFAAAKFGSQEVWNLLENVYLEVHQGNPTLEEGKEELISVVHGMSSMQVQNPQIWLLLMKRMTAHMKNHSLTCKDLCQLVYDMFVVKLQAPKMIEIIVKYFNDMNFDEKSLFMNGDRVSVNFINHIAYLHGELNDQRLFKVVSEFTRERLPYFNKYKILKILDIFKYMQHFEDKELRNLLEKQLEITKRRKSRFSDSEEEERK